MGAGLPGVRDGSGAWGDYDNDGDLDILLTGDTGSELISRVYNNDAGSFTDIVAGLPGVDASSVAWGDYDNDGNLDILLTGDTGSETISRVYYEYMGFAANTPPVAPTNLHVQQVALSPMEFSWDTATEPETPSAGLTSNPRLGTTPRGPELVTAMADGERGSLRGLRRWAAR